MNQAKQLIYTLILLLHICITLELKLVKVSPRHNINYYHYFFKGSRDMYMMGQLTKGPAEAVTTRFCLNASKRWHTFVPGSQSGLYKLEYENNQSSTLVILLLYLYVEKILYALKRVC